MEHRETYSGDSNEKRRNILNQITNDYILEEDLLELLKITMESLRDLRSNHLTGKKPFINWFSLGKKCRIYKKKDVADFLGKCPSSQV